MTSLVLYAHPTMAGWEYGYVTGALRSGQVITAAGTHAVEFSREVFEAIELFPQAEIDAWAQEFGAR